MKHPKVKEFLKYTDTIVNPYAYYLVCFLIQHMIILLQR